MENEEKAIQIEYVDEVGFSIKIFGKPLLGSLLRGRIGKGEAVIEEVHKDVKQWGTQWIILYRHPQKKALTFEGHIFVFEDYILFETHHGFDLTIKKNKSIYGNPYISFPSFEGDNWTEELNGLTFKRQAPFNYPVRWEGRAVDCLREGKNIPLLVTTKAYETAILSPLEPLLLTTVSVTHHPPRIRCGLPRAITGVKKGTVSRTLLVVGKGVHKTWMKWGTCLRDYYGTQSIQQQEDCSLESISYWTNAGSAYWYNNRGYESYEKVLRGLKEHHESIGIDYGSYQFDSWWYHKEGDHYTSGIDEWEPKSIVRSKNFNAMLPFFQRYKDLLLFQESSLEYVQGWFHKPIGCHYKQLGKECVYVQRRPEDFWVDTLALPKDREASKRHFMDVFNHPQWQLSYVIHDWLQLMNDRHDGFLDVQVGRDYFVGLDEACMEIAAPMNQSGHLGLQLCMTQPHMTLQSVMMQSVTSIRSTSDAGSFFVEGTKRWWWHLFSSHFIQALGKYAFYDHRHSKRRQWHPRSSNAAFEFLWIGLSCGPMGIGDAIGKEDVGLIRRAITSKGHIIKPDMPTAPLDQCYRHLLFHGKADYGAITQTRTEWPHYVVYYVLLFGLHPFGKKVKVEYKVTEFHDIESVVCRDYCRYHYLTGDLERVEENQESLYIMGHGQYVYHIVAPIRFEKGFIGNVAKHVTAGKQIVDDVRIEMNQLSFTFMDCPLEESMEWVCYAKKKPLEVRVDDRQVDYDWQDGKLRIEMHGNGGGQWRQCIVLW